ncbi:MBL fold metallo-hydrolase [Longibaculum muris]|uniref:MBL fold metallo-hydrolase n=1 Tax=Longibaculum muris TaxID=1796628 RepID=UPI0022E3C042|nr:MBL fold metallo-hydrolase [Longibaculum muris]
MKNKTKNKIACSLLTATMIFNGAGSIMGVYAQETIEKLASQTEETEVLKESSKTNEKEEVVEETTSLVEKKALKATESQSKVMASYEEAIKEVTNPKWDNGQKTDVPVSNDLKAKLDTTNLIALKDEKAKTLTVDIQLKNTYLASKYLNGKSPAGESYYNMVNFFTDVKQIKQLLKDNSGYSVIDSQGNQLDADYIDELHGLIAQIIDFDTSTNLKYDKDSIFNSKAFQTHKELGGTDVIATSREGHVSLKFHIDSHGWWGYDLGAHDSITGLPMGYDAKTTYENQRDLTSKYANFFVIEMGYTDNGDKCYMLNATDLENPMIYVSADGTKAFLIDVDMYGQNVLNKVIKDVIGDKCKELNVFVTHNHPDHINNLSVIASDSKLKAMTKVYWPENDYNSQYGENIFGKDKIIKLKDGDKIQFSKTTFQFIEIPNEHTVGGGQLADLTHKVLYVGDTLGAQIHLGGTNVSMSSIDYWIAGTEKTEKYVAAHDIQYFIGGHTPNLGNTAFATWVKTACQYAKDKVLKEDHSFGSGRGTTIVVENGKVISEERQIEMLTQGVSDRDELNIASISFRNDLNAFGDYDKAIHEVVIPRYEKDGSKTNQKVSELLKNHLNTLDLGAIKNEKNKTITTFIQLKDVYLNSEYLNGKSEAGMSYYNMLNFYTNVKQVKQLLDANPGYSVIDSQKNKLDKAYIDELLGLLDQINDMNPKTNLKYDMDSVYDSKVFNQETTRGGTDVVATSQEGNVSLKFHIDSHGWWGYDLGADDSITSLVMGFDQKAIDADRAERESPITKQYGNFFVIEMDNASKGKWYMLNGTDLENPIIYVSNDGKEAFMIDVDFYGENVINQVIKSVIGDKCESLKIFLTHNHGDHVNNLAQIAKDERLKEITTLVWPENEPHTKLNGVDLVELFDYTTIKDMQTIIAADNTFQFIEIPDEHTPGGGQLADLTNKVLYSGDTLGAQVHLGGGTVMMSKIDSWLNGALKSAKYIEENDIRYNIGGHTPYLNNPQFASWVAKAVQYGKEQLASDPSWKGGLIIVENGKIVDSKRMGEIFAKGLSDRDELNIASINFINDLDHKEDPDDNQVPDSNDDQTPNNNDNQNPNNNDKKPIVDNQQTTVVKTEDQSLLAGFALTALMAFVVGVVVYKKRKENE